MIERLPFGPTGHQSSRVIFGAAALWAVTPERSEHVLASLLEAGVNHIDTAASYGDSELNLRPWLADHRDRFFVATKTGERTGDGARRSLEQSLERLGTDRVDSIQLHNLVEDDEFDVAHGPGGAVEALLAARDEGLCGAVGVTGHGLRIARMHLRSLERADLASVLFPLNHSLWQIDWYRRDVEELLAQCAERGVAAQTIKSIARRRWVDSDADAGARRFSWYEPLPDGAALTRAVHFVLARPHVFLNTSSDLRALAPTLAAAATVAGVPDERALAADRADLDMAPLFDGAELERI